MARLTLTLMHRIQLQRLALVHPGRGENRLWFLGLCSCVERRQPQWTQFSKHETASAELRTEAMISKASLAFTGSPNARTMFTNYSFHPPIAFSSLIAVLFLISRSLSTWSHQSLVWFLLLLWGTFLTLSDPSAPSWFTLQSPPLCSSTSATVNIPSRELLTNFGETPKILRVSTTHACGGGRLTRRFGNMAILSIKPKYAFDPKHCLLKSNDLLTWCCATCQWLSLAYTVTTIRLNLSCSVFSTIFYITPTLSVAVLH